MSLEENINIAAQAISQADALLISAGLGMGTDSGLPRFNNEENYLESFEEWYKAGISYGLITDPQSFHDSPEKIWAFYWHCLQRHNSPRRFSANAGNSEHQTRQLFCFHLKY